MKMVLAMMLMAGCVTIGEEPGPPVAPKRAETRPMIDCGPAPVEPRWSAHPNASNPDITEVPSNQWRDVAVYLSDVRNWRDCLAFVATQ